MSEKQKRYESSVVIDNTKIDFFFDIHKKMIITGENERLLIHSHTFNELFLVEKGSIEILLSNSKSIVLNAGDSLLIAPGIPHKKNDQSNDAIWYSVCFLFSPTSRSRFNSLYTQLSYYQSQTEPLLFRKSVPIQYKIDEMIRALSNKSKNWLFVLRLLDFLISSREENHNLSFSPVGISRLAEIERLIDAQYFDPITPQEVADMLYISIRQLNRLSKKRYGKSFRRALIERRNEIAIKLLETTEKPVEKIGDEVGFITHSAFYRSFVLQYGVSPFQYRKDYLRKTNAVKEQADHSEQTTEKTLL